MGMAEDIAHIRFVLSQVTNLNDAVNAIDGIRDKLKYDIEPKLDKALEGKTTTDPIKPDINQQLWLVRQIAVEVRHNEKIGGIRCLRELTGCGLKEAKETIEWLFDHSPYREKEAE